VKLTDRTCKDEPGEPARLFAFPRMPAFKLAMQTRPADLGAIEMPRHKHRLSE